MLIEDKYCSTFHLEGGYWFQLHPVLLRVLDTPVFKGRLDGNNPLY